MKITYEVSGSPVGDLFLAESDRDPVAVLFRKTKKIDGTVKWIEKTYPDAAVARGKCPETRHRLMEFFAGKPGSYPFPENLKGTPFEMAVWKEISKIPFGRTKTYGEIAKKLGRPNGSRAVGKATGSNPVSILIPCHRVVGSTGNLTGYGGGMPAKIWLLRHEGVLMGLEPRGGAAVR